MEGKKYAEMFSAFFGIWPGVKVPGSLYRVGSLEYHGEHLAVGLDALKAEL
jgi:hypothetical protein